VVYCTDCFERMNIGIFAPFKVFGGLALISWKEA
jgi:hypothetical protein